MPQLLPPVEPTSPDVIREKIHSGEFFRESQLEYHRKYHDIMSERYIYLGITILSVIIFVLAFVAMSLFFPLSTRVPFIYSTNDIVNDLPIMTPISKPGQDVNQALQQYLLKAYVETRESYDPDKLDLRAAIVKAQSEPGVFQAYSAALDPRNPDSMIAKFQRRALKTIEVHSIHISGGGTERTADVAFTATITEGVVVRKESGNANITFRFDDVQVDQNTGAATKLNFVVSAYRVTLR